MRFFACSLRWWHGGCAALLLYLGVTWLPQRSQQMEPARAKLELRGWALGAGCSLLSATLPSNPLELCAVGVWLSISWCLGSSQGQRNENLSGSFHETLTRTPPSAQKVHTVHVKARGCFCFFACPPELWLLNGWLSYINNLCLNCAFISQPCLILRIERSYITIPLWSSSLH
jgi:hypothetical protein